MRRGIEIWNGIKDREAIRFQDIELERVRENTGSYVGVDAGGTQILLNFRQGESPFRVFSMGQVLRGEVNPQELGGRILLIGLTAQSVTDQVYVGSIPGTYRQLVNGVEVQAHAVSALVSAVLDHRSQLRGWPETWESAWIILWGFLGISIGRIIRSAWRAIGIMSLGVLLLTLTSYGLILQGIWIPLVPSILVFVLNGGGLTGVLFYRYRQDMQHRLEDRQAVIEQTFTAIHNGPLQRLTQLLRETQNQSNPNPTLLEHLHQLNRELRTVYEVVQQETQDQQHRLHLNPDHILDLSTPLHELLRIVYERTLDRPFPCFASLRVTVVSLDRLEENRLNLATKRSLCRFLEEALCNAGKYGIGMTRLEVYSLQEKGCQVIRVIDNGQGSIASAEGIGSQQAHQLARRLGGTFRREPRSPQGTLCELSWPLSRIGFW